MNPTIITKDITEENHRFGKSTETTISDNSLDYEFDIPELTEEEATRQYNEYVSGVLWEICQQIPVSSVKNWVDTVYKNSCSDEPLERPSTSFSDVPVENLEKWDKEETALRYEKVQFQEGSRFKKSYDASRFVELAKDGFKSQSDLVQDLMFRIIKQNPGISKNGIFTTVRDTHKYTESPLWRSLDSLISDRLVDYVEGPRNAKLYSVCEKGGTKS